GPMSAARAQPYRSSILLGAVLVTLLIGAAVPRGAAAVSCDADIRGGGPSGWSVNGALGTFDNGVLFTDGLDAVRDDAFDNGGQAGVDNAAYINPHPSGCRRAINGHGVNFPSAIVNGIGVKPKLYFEAKRPVARSLVLLTNPGTSLVQIEYSIDGEPGSDAATKIGTTSNGNATVETADAWATTCEDKASDGCAKTGG